MNMDDFHSIFGSFLISMLLSLLLRVGNDNQNNDISLSMSNLDKLTIDLSSSDRKSLPSSTHEEEGGMRKMRKKKEEEKMTKLESMNVCGNWKRKRKRKMVYVYV